MLKDMPIGSIKVLAMATGQFGFPEKNGKAQIAVQFIVSPNDQDYPNEYITWYQMLETDQNFEFAWKGLRACGVKGDDLADLTGITSNEVELVIQAEMWEDKKQIRVQWVNPPGGPQLKIEKPVGAAQLRALSARAKAAALKSRGGSSAAPAPVAAPPTFAPAPPLAPNPATDGPGAWAPPVAAPPVDDGTSFDPEELEAPQY